MEILNLIDTFSEFREQKNIDRSTMMRVIEDVFRSTLIKLYGSADNYDIIINPDRGDFEIWQNRVVVADDALEDPNVEITLTAAREIEGDYEIGEEVSNEFKFEEVGRRAILALRQNLAAKIQEIEKEHMFNKYKERVGEIITAEVYQVWKKEILLIDDEGTELILPRTEQIPGDFFHKSDTVKAVVVRVEYKNGNPQVVLSRTSEVFVERLFEMEVPEIFDGLITIKNIVRIPGERAKVAVESYDDRIDPVGACVGMKGSRIRGIVRELRNENIDVINFTNNTQLYITRALTPAKITRIKLDEENKTAEVYLPVDQVSMAIGRNGANIKLAGLLTEYEIDVYRDDVEDEEDVNLEEFKDEIDEWVLSTLKSIGCDTAKSVLELTPEELIARTDLEVETIQEVLRVLNSEFE
ncbi:MAG: transcription termination factor NusA [Salinivirgaceae bacterium]|nr:transcription termination factor NusA [Salinivirgaceae bacterium]MDY0279889.1 transcription termination factor NusA [Salinivirgaceae bacterium]